MVDIKNSNANLDDVVNYSTDNEYKLWEGDVEFHNIKDN